MFHRLFRFLDHGRAKPGGGGWLDRWHISPRWLAETPVRVALPHLPPSWEGAKLVQVSDLHIGPICGLDYVRRIVEAANAQRPDVVVFTGDLVNHASACTREVVGVLAGLEARDARLAVLGNHDHSADADAVGRTLSEAGFTVLHNSHRMVLRDGQPLCIAGVEDRRKGTPDLAAALAGVPEDVARVLLEHNPDYAEEMPPRPRVDLMLCGHTHAGQVSLPLLGPPFLSIKHRRFGAGLAQGPCCPVYTSRGLGMVYLPIRWNCRPELPVFTLLRA
jgi:hypothetical protein